MLNQLYFVKQRAWVQRCTNICKIKRMKIGDLSFIAPYIALLTLLAAFASLTDCKGFTFDVWLAIFSSCEATLEGNCFFPVKSLWKVEGL